jgi:hypothetical protein
MKVMLRSSRKTLMRWRENCQNQRRLIRKVSSEEYLDFKFLSKSLSRRKSTTKRKGSLGENLSKKIRVLTMINSLMLLKLSEITRIAISK